MKRFSLKTSSQTELVDITDKVRSFVNETSKEGEEGICHVYVPHTTAAVTVNESADPAVAQDISRHLTELIPENKNYSHLEGNADAHIKTSMIGNSTQILVEDGNLMLGRWQGIFFCEFDGPRTRNFWVLLS